MCEEGEAYLPKQAADATGGLPPLACALKERELAEWSIAVSLKLIWFKINHIRSNRIFSAIYFGGRLNRTV